MRTNKGMRLILGIAVLGFLAGLASCSEDEPVFGKPTLTLGGSATVVAKPGADFEVTLNLAAEGGNGALIVNKNGGFLERIELDRNAATYTYEGTADATALEGDNINYQFVLLNRQNLESDPVAATVNIEVYDKITVGTTELFQVPASTVAAGTTVKWAQGRSYFVAGSLLFESGSTFTVEAGVTAFMNTTGTTTVEINLTGANVSVQGTASNPVVMTSDRTLRGESPAAGNWNQFRLQDIQNATIRYVRIEYAGDALRLVNAAANNTLEYIQAFKSNRGFYFTNGNANARYLYALDCPSTNVRLGDAYAGRIQFLISNDPTYYPEIEELDIRETAAPVLANITILGPGTSSTPNNTHGVRLRSSSSGKIYNAVVAEFPRRGVRLNDNVQVTDLTGPTVFAHSFVFNVPVDPFREDRASPNNTNPFPGTFDGTTGERLTNPFVNNVTNRLGAVWTLTPIAGIGINDFTPNAEQASAFNPTALGNFFVTAPFVGAIRDNSAASDWTRGGWAKNADGTIR